MSGHFKPRNNEMIWTSVCTNTWRKSRAHRYIGYWGFNLTENFCHQGIKNSEITRLDQGHLSAGTRGGDPNHRGSPDRKVNRCIGVRYFVSPKDKTSGASEVTKSRETIRTVHLEEDAWRRSEHSGGFPKRK
jgi:hypothetical protein